MLRRKYRKIYFTFSVPIKKEVANDDNSKKKEKQKLKFIDSYRFMQCRLSDLVDNLSGINKKECPTCIEKKNKIRMQLYRF